MKQPMDWLAKIVMELTGSGDAKDALAAIANWRRQAARVERLELDLALAQADVTAEQREAFMAVEVATHKEKLLFVRSLARKTGDPAWN